jgi:imidazolonepropionase-like amidohydrolase
MPVGFAGPLRLIAAAALAWSGGAVAATTVIQAGHLIAQPGNPATSNQSIVIEDGKITAIQNGYVAGDTVIDLKDSWVMPGLIDMHTHVSGLEKLDEPVAGQIALAYMGRPAETVLNTLPRLKTLLMNGFTTVRNVGDPTYTTYALRDAVNKGIVPGPRMFVTEVQISVAGGDYDASNWDMREDLEKFVSNRGNCSGAAECVRVIREEVRRGADVIKFRQGGLAVEDPRIKMSESPEEIKAIIDTAHQLDRRVAVHVAGTPEFLHAVIEAGADTIEHGPLDDVSIAMMKKRGISNTPTLLAGKLIDYKFKECLEGVGKAYRAGVPIMFGTDLGIMGPERSHEEFALLAQAGIPPAQVLRTATVNAAAGLGPLGDALGSIAKGKSADIIATRFDPLGDIGNLGAPGKVTFVMKEGIVYKEER